jgi:Protein of unknown function (DUF742)
LSFSDDQPEPSLLRPFLIAGRGTQRGAALDDNGNDSAVRSFTMTAGRARAAVQLGFEAMMRSTETGKAQLPALNFERAAIVELCAVETLSIAEVSARLEIPIGVIRVLAADLLTEELIQVFVPTKNVADDVSLLAGLIASVRAL